MIRLLIYVLNAGDEDTVIDCTITVANEHGIRTVRADRIDAGHPETPPEG